jgi:RNA polymerase sigma-70 factor (ECF subfamily)
MRAGDLAAFEDVYRQHGKRLYNLGLRMLGQAAEAEDALQDVFLQAFRMLGSFKGESALGTWLYRLALNQCLDFVRGRPARMSGVTGSLEDDRATEPAAPRDTPVMRLDLERAVQRLPGGYRAAFVLHDIEGFEHKEIGELLGITEGTSRSQVFKARMKLRAMLG